MPAAPDTAATPGSPPVRVVRVVPDVAALRKAFDYSVPAELATQVRIGTQVRVVLQGRRVAGWVVADGVEPPPGVELRPLAAVRGWGPPPAVIELASWSAWRWAGPVSTFLRTASAPTVVRRVPGTPPALSRAGAAGPLPAAARAAAEVAGAALGGATSVVRLAPGADPLPLCDAAGALAARDAPAGTLVLAPGHHLAAEVAGRLRRLGHTVALLPGDWAAARAGGCVVVGTRAAAFAPLPRLGAAVVLDAHDEAYHEERAPTWSAWAVVAERARRDDAPCVLVSAVPTLEILAAGRLLTTSRAAERQGWPAVEVVDRRGDDPRTGLFSERLVRLLHDIVARRGARAVCVVNRTGRVRLLSCVACNELARCERCDAAVELADGRPRPGDPPPDAAPFPTLRCRRCDARRPVVCAKCGGTRLKALRVGVSRVREELEALVKTPVTEVWGPAPRGEAGAIDDTAVVVGTEAALHRVPRADAVAFLEFDNELLAPRFAAAEQALALLARAARLVSNTRGPGARAERAPGRVLVQTRLARHDALVAAVSADPALLAGPELAVREALGLPPCSALAVVSGPAADTYGAALVAAAPTGVVVRGPTDGVWSVRAPDHAVLCDVLAAVPRPPGRLRVEVDPVRA